IVWLHFTRARLDAPAEFERAAMTLALLQRIYLEMWACLLWLSEFRDRLMSPPPIIPETPLDVVGVCVGDLASAERLYRAGIPVWLIRPLSERETLEVKKWVDVPINVISLNVRSGGFSLSTADAAPPYAIVYEGRIDPGVPYHHYWLMAQYLANAIDQNAFMPSDNLYKFRQNVSNTGPSHADKHLKD
ncbi:hypothetical protein MPER_04455, partial [Moniliophthora perniciosa FA553]